MIDGVVRPGLAKLKRVVMARLSRQSKMNLLRDLASDLGVEALFADYFSRSETGRKGPTDSTDPTPSMVRTAAFEWAREAAEGDERTPNYALRTFTHIHLWIEQYAGGLERKRIVELGPGCNLIVGSLLVASGAARYVGADLYPVASLDPAVFRRLRAELEADCGVVRPPGHYEHRARMLRRFDEVIRINDTEVIFDQERLAWCYPADATKLPFDHGSFDVCLSNATLEHVRDPLAAVRESVRILVPGGHGLHQIDYRDHRDFATPLDFLRYGRREWQALFEEPGKAPEHTNRWRHSDFLEAFRSAGAEVLRADVNCRAEVPIGLRAQLHPDFSERGDLETLGAFFVVRKPTTPGS